MSLKNSNETIRNRTRDLPALAQCLNQLRHRVFLISLEATSGNLFFEFLERDIQESEK